MDTPSNGGSSQTGVRVRNQSVLIAGVNDEFLSIQKTMKQLAHLMIEPYYVYLHDMIPGCEHMRTPLHIAEDISLKLQGSMTGFNTPRVVCDTPGGGGKRDVSSYIKYNREVVLGHLDVKRGKYFTTRSGT